MKEPDIEILVVEDDDEIGTMVADHLTSTIADRAANANITVRRAHSAVQALDFFHARPADVVIADLALPDEDGLAMIRKMRAHANPSVLIITGHATLGKAVESMRLGARDMFVKPFDLSRITDAVNAAVDAQFLKKRNEIRQRRLQELASRIVRERRELRRRVDLVCHDLVGAYRDLAAKFVEQDQAAGDGE
jgi:DNA-binding NtrC family response regulator